MTSLRCFVPERGTPRPGCHSAKTEHGAFRPRERL
jgi:hypothetical protein